MDEPNSPYVFRDEPDESTDDHADAEVVIVDGRAMSYRWYRR
ncbi:MAG: hypothetical protein ABEH78_05560 [Haloferacaceae archaeon]